MAKAAEVIRSGTTAPPPPPPRSAPPPTPPAADSPQSGSQQADRKTALLKELKSWRATLATMGQGPSFESVRQHAQTKVLETERLVEACRPLSAQLRQKEKDVEAARKRLANGSTVLLAAQDEVAEAKQAVVKAELELTVLKAQLEVEKSEEGKELPRSELTLESPMGQLLAQLTAHAATTGNLPLQQLISAAAVQVMPAPAQPPALSPQPTAVPAALPEQASLAELPVLAAGPQQMEQQLHQLVAEGQIGQQEAMARLLADSGTLGAPGLPSPLSPLSPLGSVVAVEEVTEEETNTVNLDTDMAQARLPSTRLRPFGSSIRKPSITGRHSSVLESLGKTSAVAQNKVRGKIGKQRSSLDAVPGSDDSGPEDQRILEDPYGTQQSQEPRTPQDPRSQDPQQFELSPRLLEPALASVASPLER